MLARSTSPRVDKSIEVLAVIVETREHPAIELVIQNMEDVLGLPIQFFHGTGNRQSLVDSSLVKKLEESGRLTLVQLDTADLDAGCYNALLLCTEFWETLIGRKKVLVFQSDSLLCRQSVFELSDFFEFDYIGSAWNRYRPIGIVADGGNGGFSLRDWQKSRESLESYTVADWPGGEDSFFAFHLEFMGGRVGKPSECNKFSTQIRFNEYSFGCHKVTDLRERDLDRFLRYCPEAEHFRR